MALLLHNWPQNTNQLTHGGIDVFPTKSTLLAALLIVVPSVATAQSSFYVRAGATGSNNGSDWANAFTALPSALQRNGIYYVADGSYGRYVFDDPASGSAFITVKKATAADHGTNVGWLTSYGDGQAVFASPIAFTSSYYVFDGNGSHMVPSNRPGDYGFQIYSNSDTNTSGIVQIGASGAAVTDIAVRYTHVYNTTNGSINNGTVSVRFYPGAASTRIKLQNNYLQNSGKDGIQISNSRTILIERNYIERLARKLAGTPDYHGQSVQMFWNVRDVIFRWNVWEACEGQSLIAYGDDGTTTQRIRFYSNVIFTAYGTIEGAGFNLSGGLLGNAWPAAEVSSVFIYNNTVVNQRDSYTTSRSTATHFPIHASTSVVRDVYAYNNLFYNSETSFTNRFTASSYHASGGYGTAGGANEQTGLQASVFAGFTTNDYRLVTSTNAGMNLTTQAWWNANADAFFGSLDSPRDMSGATRGTDGNWDRGAFECVSCGGGGTTPNPTAPTNLRIIR